MADSANERRTVLLDDAPASEDAFGPHERIANAIVSIIQSEDGGRAIGIEGGWGSGKSTVVNFVRKALHASSDFRVLSFDAWAHEGDPLRRTYLETVVTELTSVKWLDAEAWKDTLDKLANRRKTTTTRTTPTPTWLGAVFAVSLVLVPIGTTLFRHIFNEQSTSNLSDVTTWSALAWLCVLSATAPLGVLLSNALRVWIARPLYRWSRRRLGYAIQANEAHKDWAFLLSRAVEVVRTDTTETPNPTSIEFEAYFNRAMSEALDEAPSRRLVLVLDNLDRVEPANAIGIWSTLQTFLQERNSHSASWYPQVWVVVPYDPSGLSRLWDNRTAGSTDSLESSNDVDRTIASDSFLAKSFQIRFQVPPPVLSDWKAYLCSLLAIALPDHDQSDWHKVYRVYEESRTNRPLPPSPRELKLFVNQIGALHRQWGDDFPIGHIAYFVLHSRDRGTLLKKLKSADIPSAEISRLLDGNVRENLAGLFFGVPSAKGMELLLGDLIYESLSEGASAKLKQHAEIYGQSFWTVAEGVVASRVADASPNHLAKSGQAFHESGLLASGHSLESAAIRRMLRDSVLAVQNWTPVDEDIVAGLVAVLELFREGDFSRQLVASFCESVEVSDDAESSLTPRDACLASIQLFSAVSDLGFGDAIPDAVTIPGDASEWVAACSALSTDSSRRSMWGRLKSVVPPSELADTVRTAVEGGEFADEHLSLIDVTSCSVSTATWDTIPPAVQARLDASAGVAVDEARRLLECLWYLRTQENKKAVKAMSALATGGHIAHHLHQASKQPEARALFAMTLLLEDASLPAPPAVGNSAAGHQALTNVMATQDAGFATELCHAMGRFGGTAQILEVIDAREAYDPLIGQCLRTIASDSNPFEVFTNEVFLGRWQEVREAIASEEEDEDNAFEDLLSRLVAERDLCNSIMSSDTGFGAPDATLYWTILHVADSAPPSFKDWCKASLERVDRDEWLSDLEGSHECIWLGCLLADKGLKLELTTQFLDALVDNAKDIAKNSHVPEEAVLKRWAEVKGFLEEGPRQSLQTRMLSLAVDADGNIAEPFFEMYGDELAAAEVLRANNRTVEGLFSPIVRQRNVAGLSWLKDTLQQRDGLLESLTGQNTQEFKTRLQDCVNDPEGDEAQGLIGSIAALVGVQPELAEDGTAEASDDEHGE